MNLTPQQQKIVDYLADGTWKCMADEFFMKDDRTRISELNRMGFEIVGIKCDKSCGKKHSSRVLMRKMLKRGDGIPMKPKVQQVIQLPNGHVQVSYA